MQIYLPIAELSVNAFLLLGLGGIVGVLSGMFGVGGGFLITPLLFFIGIPPAVAVATGANQIVASSFSALLVHLKRKTVDLRMGSVLLAGGLVGAAAGVTIFNYLKSLGQVDLRNLCGSTACVHHVSHGHHCPIIRCLFESDGLPRDMKLGGVCTIRIRHPRVTAV